LITNKNGVVGSVEITRLVATFGARKTHVHVLQISIGGLTESGSEENRENVLMYFRSTRRRMPKRITRELK
jgi:hypothetical protein